MLQIQKIHGFKNSVKFDRYIGVGPVPNIISSKLCDHRMYFSTSFSINAKAGRWSEQKFELLSYSLLHLTYFDLHKVFSLPIDLNSTSVTNDRPGFVAVRYN